MTQDTNEPSRSSPDPQNGYINRAFVEDATSSNGNLAFEPLHDDDVQNGNDIGLQGMRNGSTRNSKRQDDNGTTVAVADDSNSGAVHLAVCRNLLRIVNLRFVFNYECHATFPYTRQI